MAGSMNKPMGPSPSPFGGSSPLGPGPNPFSGPNADKMKQELGQRSNSGGTLLNAAHGVGDSIWRSLQPTPNPAMGQAAQNLGQDLTLLKGKLGELGAIMPKTDPNAPKMSAESNWSWFGRANPLSRMFEDMGPNARPGLLAHDHDFDHIDGPLIPKPSARSMFE